MPDPTTSRSIRGLSFLRYIVVRAMRSVVDLRYAPQRETRCVECGSPNPDAPFQRCEACATYAEHTNVY